MTWAGAGAGFNGRMERIAGNPSIRSRLASWALHIAEVEIQYLYVQLL